MSSIFTSSSLELDVFFLGFPFFAVLAQLVEHRYRKPAVTGSTPAHGICNNFKTFQK